MTKKQLGTLLNRPEIRKKILGNFSGKFCLAVTDSPKNSGSPAIYLGITAAHPDQFPSLIDLEANKSPSSSIQNGKCPPPPTSPTMPTRFWSTICTLICLLLIAPAEAADIRPAAASLRLGYVDVPLIKGSFIADPPEDRDLPFQRLALAEKRLAWLQSSKQQMLALPGSNFLDHFASYNFDDMIQEVRFDINRSSRGISSGDRYMWLLQLAISDVRRTEDLDVLLDPSMIYVGKDTVMAKGKDVTQVVLRRFTDLWRLQDQADKDKFDRQTLLLHPRKLEKDEHGLLRK